MSMDRLYAMNGAPCDCGRPHSFSACVISGPGAVAQLPKAVGQFGAKKVFVLTDLNTYEAAGRHVCSILAGAGIQFQSYTLPEREPHPDEQRVGAAVMHMEPDCGLVIGVVPK